MRIKEFEELCGFRPKFSYFEFEDLFNRTHTPSVRFKNTKLLKLIKRLAGLAYPDKKYTHVRDRRWYNFYLPLRRGEAIVVPLAIVNYRNMFALIPNNFTSIEVYPGNSKIEKYYYEVVKEALRFSKVLKKHPAMVKKCLPLDIRTGKVLGKYVLAEVLSKKEKARILNRYKAHLKRMKFLHAISLEDYLNTAAICYKAAFGKEAETLAPIEMYKRWADGRDCGMLKIKNKTSERAFTYWLKHKSHCGGHPFEIVFSWFEHGIRLYPPSKEQPWFLLCVTNYAYAKKYIKMAEALIKNSIPFKALGIEDVLNYLAGETYFRVNEYAKHFIFYTPELKSIRKYIKWDPIKTPKWK